MQKPLHIHAVCFSEKNLPPEQQELIKIIKQSATTAEEKFKILEARDKLIRLRTKKYTDLMKAKVTVGTCPDMCPEKERLMRETQHQVINYYCVVFVLNNFVFRFRCMSKRLVVKR